jgi:hypothetical protein
VSEEDKLRSRLPEVTSDPPDVEWWDKPLLDGGAYYTAAAAADHHQQQQDEQQQQQDGGSQGDADMQQDGDHQQQQQQKGARMVVGVSENGLEMRVKLVRLTRYVEHPVLLEPPDEGPPPAPQPLKLTKRCVTVCV